MTVYDRGDVVLVPYPFGDRPEGRRRPALVISTGEYSQITGEVVVAQITSRVSGPARPGDYLIQDWQVANLPRPAMVRSRLATLKVSLVLRRLGSLAGADLEGAGQALRATFCLG